MHFVANYTEVCFGSVLCEGLLVRCGLVGGVEVYLTGQGRQGNPPPVCPQTTECGMTASNIVACRQAFCKSW